MKAPSKSWKPFSPTWWQQPIQVRFVSVTAIQAGLLVQVESLHRYWDNRENDVTCPLVTWRGNTAQFLATGFFDENKLPTVGRSRWLRVHDVLGTMFRPSQDEFFFQIERHNDTSPIRTHRRAIAAKADQAFLNFRDKVMAGFPREDLGCES